MQRLLAVAAAAAMVFAFSACRSHDSVPGSQPLTPSATATASTSGGGATATPVTEAVERPPAPAVGAAPGSGADWPRWRGPSGNGISPEAGINKNWKSRPPAEVWKVSMSDDGCAGPSVADGKVFIVDHQGSEDVVRALDLATGQDKWRRPYADTDGANYGYARATPVYDDGKLYTMSRLGVLHCLDASNGTVVWKRDIISEFGGKRPQWDMAGSPLIDGNVLIVSPGAPNAAVAALDKATGKTVWQGGGNDVPGYATPVPATLGGARQYLVFTSKHAQGVDARNGSVLWSYGWNTSYDVNAATPVPIGNSVFITSGYGTGCALLDISAAGATPRWTNKEIVSRFTTPILWQGYLYCTGESGALTCVDPKTGQALWKAPGFEWGGAVLVDGVLIVQSGSNGDTVMVSPSPQGYKELGRFTPLGGQSWTAPIVSHGKLIVRNQKTLACYDLK